MCDVGADCSYGSDCVVLVQVILGVDSGEGDFGGVNGDGGGEVDGKNDLVGVGGDGDGEGDFDSKLMVFGHRWQLLLIYSLTLVDKCLFNYYELSKLHYENK